MRIGILSDTHNQRDRTLRALDSLKSHGAELLIHCGDFVDAAILELLAGLPCYFVFGNNDSDAISELRSAAKSTGAICLDWGGVATIEGKRLAITHGHLRSEVRSLLAQEPDYLLSGHSHRMSNSFHGPTRRINPGALHRAREFSVALLDLTTDELRFLDVLTMSDGGAVLRKFLP